MFAFRALALLPALFLARCGGSIVAADADARDGGSAESGDDAAKDAANDVTIDVGIDVPVSDGGIASIAGVVLWLDAAKGVTMSSGTITGWTDQSSQGNDASGGAASPTLVSSSIHSLPAAHFVAASAQYVSIADATSLQFGTGDFYIAVVSKFDNDPSQGVSRGIGALYTKLGPASGMLFFANDFDYSNNAVLAGLSNLENPTPTQVAFAAAYNDGAPRLYALQRVGSSEVLRVDGTEVAASASSTDLSESGVEVDIGHMAKSHAASLDGDIAEVVVVKGALSPADRATIESYLQSKYAL